MAPDRTILHLVKKIPDPLPHLKNYGVHTIKPQLRPWRKRKSENTHPVTFDYIYMSSFLALYACYVNEISVYIYIKYVEL